MKRASALADGDYIRNERRTARAKCPATHSRQVEELFACCGIGSEQRGHRRRDGLRCRSLYTTDRHALMFGFHYDAGWSSGHLRQDRVFVEREEAGLVGADLMHRHLLVSRIQELRDLLDVAIGVGAAGNRFRNVVL